MNANAASLIRAIRGPMMLIAFGTLMALNHMDIFGFDRSWPVLIIVYGFFKLLERSIGPVPPPWPQPGYPQPQYPSAEYPPVYRQQPPQGGSE